MQQFDNRILPITAAGGREIEDQFGLTLAASN